MPLGYLLLAVCTAAALIAPRHPRAVGAASFFFGVVVNELPQLGLAYLAATTALALIEGDLSGPIGMIAIAVALLTVVGLAELGRRGLRAKQNVIHALRDAGLEDSVVRWRSAWRSLIAPFPVRPRSVKRSADIAYGADRKHRLDVYRRPDAHGAPVLLYLHGGGYYTGGKHWEGRALLYRLASQGWVCISANYRLRPAADFPDHLDDAQAVIRWAGQHVAALGGDPGTLVMAGSSAGAHLTALCALEQEKTVDTAMPRIDAAVCLYSYYGRYYGRPADESPVSTPLSLDAAAAPPFFVAHGDRDTYVAVEGARGFVQHLRAASPSPVVYAELEGGQHAFDLFRSWRGAAVVDGVEAFLVQVLTRKKAAPCAS
jgi:acetyl esterase/lipase